MGASRTAGLSLLETLLFLAILAVILALGGFWWQGLREQMQLREAAAQFAVDLGRARAEARRQGQDWRVTVGTGGSYWIGLVGNQVARNLPYGVVFRNQGQLTFTAPYGLLDVPDRTFTLALRTRELKVNVIGLTGKVVIQSGP